MNEDKKIAEELYLIRHRLESLVFLALARECREAGDMAAAEKYGAKARQLAGEK